MRHYERLDALKQGVNDYVVKPFTPNILIEKVNTIVKK